MQAHEAITGLGQDQLEDGAVEEYDDCYVTADGEIVPKAGPNAQEEVDIEADVEETFVKARRAPAEPTEAERVRHEATHLPYRSWLRMY